ncbi:MAG TPA: sulfatase [Verrucomicrobiae bacterium]|nr:sulfatase [Verrucomicrobiae bacterium]
MSQQKSIVLVTVDCLRADHVGFMGYDRCTTPFLDSLAAESFVVPAAIVAGAPTYYSFPAILASRYPLALGRDVLGLAPGEVALASVLQQSGYATAAFSAANPYISSRFGYRQGFDTFEDFLAGETLPELEQRPPSNPTRRRRINQKLQQLRGVMGPLRLVYDELYFQYCQRAAPQPGPLDALRRFPAADIIVDRACEWLRSAGERPAFLWLHLMDPHSPYYPKPEALEMMESNVMTASRARYLNSYWNRSDLGPSRLAHHRDSILGLYDAGIRWVDTQLARLIETLRQSGRWEDCIFALTADHGEEFLDHGGRYHPPSHLAEELIRVPLLVRIPGAAKREVSKSPFSMIHLAPTLLDAARLTAPRSFRGRSCFPQLQCGETFEAPAISECVSGCTNPFSRKSRLGSRVLSVREARFKLVVHFDSRTENLYDLESDAGEQAPLAADAEKAVRRRLLAIARAHLTQSARELNGIDRVRALLRDLQLEWNAPAGRSLPVAP